MNKKITFITIPVILIIIFGIYQFFFKEKKSSFSLATVSRGNISQEVSATGTVEMGEKINLGFKNSGRIEKIDVEVGDKVMPGQELMKLETDQLSIQLKEAEANLEAQKAKLLELQKGPRPEEIQISQTLLDKAKNDLNGLYNDTSTILNQAYNLADNAIRQQIAALFLYRAEATIPYYDLTYKYCDSQAAADATLQRKISENELNNWRNELQNLSKDQEILDEATLKAEGHLTVLQNFLKRLNDTFVITPNCNLTSEDINKVNTYKSAASLALTNINTALTSILSQKKAIEAQKLFVQNYQEQLNLKLAGPTQEQITYQEALVKQADAEVSLLENQIEESILKSPVEGKITKINKRIGEIVQPALAESIISLLPNNPFQIKVDIYEEDVVKMDIGNSVDISFTAFPDEVFKGKVVSINPAETIIEGVVYYEVKINLENIPGKIKPGMTADVSIKTASRENVLVITKNALEKKDSKIFVQVLKGKNLEEKEIEVGLEGSNDMVEVLSGLTEGETVVIK